ncbi:hypothetical protein RO3G_15611 [Rhizopus delemar RA 99-880]|uniref:CS domain-containing protein n=1 Tax=Rhizopus delemar (strain RA 99-880 / ATCC MYA-4621 / FGSC 9543 / NRRL 43880) TaxID=246409 RepID=I1CR20_RHIO9|nr:hypothetical protein RO3G_15611 [Rhizopus delemar RA 99-880]|eukprot:EIE90900.1 hypothetical protein RO3G_15611 [Rhizopus delemar RA 99-880]
MINLSQKYDLNVQERSIELDIPNINHSAIYKFKINQLYHLVQPKQSYIKFKENKIVIVLSKQIQGKEWSDLRMKSTQTVFHELQRSSKPIPASIHVDTSFFNTTDSHHHE